MENKKIYTDAYPNNAEGIKVELDLAHSPYKILAHEDLLRKYINGEKINPIHLRVGLTNSCNARCNFCNFHSKNEEDFYDNFDFSDALQTELAIKFFTEFAHNGGKAITFCGSGECTIHPEYAPICDACNKAGLQIGLITNGITLINPDILECVCRTHTWVRVGMNAGSRETYKLITNTCEQNFDSILEAVSKIRNNAVMNEFRIGMNFVITLQNCNEIVKAAELCKKSGAHYLRFEPEFYTGLAHKSISTKLDDIQVLLDEARLFSDDNFEVSIPKLDRGEMTNTDVVEGDFTQCNYCNFVAALGADGCMYPCPQIHLNSEYGYGRAIDIGYNAWVDKGEKQFWQVLNGDRRTKCKTCYYRPQQELLSWLKNGKLDLEETLAEYKKNNKETLHKNFV